MLVDPHQTTQETKQEVAFIIAHELAHQWFGNLVVRISSLIYFLLTISSIRFVDNGMVE